MKGALDEERGGDSSEIRPTATVSEFKRKNALTGLRPLLPREKGGAGEGANIRKQS